MSDAADRRLPLPRRALAGLALVAALAACGRKGDLYLPDEPKKPEGDDTSTDTGDDKSMDSDTLDLPEQ